MPNLAHAPVFDYPNITAYAENYKSWISSLHVVLHPPVMSSILHLNTLFSNTLSLDYPLYLCYEME
jgi:hypothetical protein